MQQLGPIDYHHCTRSIASFDACGWIVKRHRWSSFITCVCLLSLASSHAVALDACHHGAMRRYRTLNFLKTITQCAVIVDILSAFWTMSVTERTMIIHHAYLLLHRLQSSWTKNKSKALWGWKAKLIDKTRLAARNVASFRSNSRSSFTSRSSRTRIYMQLSAEKVIFWKIGSIKSLPTRASINSLTLCTIRWRYTFVPSRTIAYTSGADQVNVTKNLFIHNIRVPAVA